MPPRRRQIGEQSLQERLDRWHLNPDGDPELTLVAKDAWEASLESYKFDKATESTQKRRRRYLTEYTKYILGSANVNGTLDEEDVLLWGELTYSLDFQGP